MSSPDVVLTDAEWDSLTEASFRGGAKAWRAQIERIVTARLAAQAAEHEDLRGRVEALADEFQRHYLGLDSAEWEQGWRSGWKSAHLKAARRVRALLRTPLPEGQD